MPILPDGVDIEITPSGGTAHFYRAVDDPKTGARAIDGEKVPLLGEPTEPGVVQTAVPFRVEKVWDDWSMGSGWRKETRRGQYFFSGFADATSGHPHPTQLSAVTDGGVSGVSGDPLGFFEVGATLFMIVGLIVRNLTTVATDQTFSAAPTGFAQFGFDSTGAHTYVGFGGTSTVFSERTGAGVWGSAAAGLYATYFTTTSDGRLWRAYESSTNKALVSNCSTTGTVALGTGPSQVANWSAGITVGSPDVPITGLATIGEALFVAKEDGLYYVNSSGDTANLIPEVASYRDPENGKGVYSWKKMVLYPHIAGLFAYDGYTVFEVSPTRNKNGVDEEQPLQGRPVAMVGDDEDLYCLFDISSQPRRAITAFQVTANSGSTYTNATANASDFSRANTTSYSSHGTLAGGWWTVVGAAAQFEAIDFDLSAFNSNASSVHVALWDGSGWNINCEVADRTRVVGATLGKSGTISFKPVASSAAWATSTINSVGPYYYARLTYTAALDASVTVNNVYVVSRTSVISTGSTDTWNWNVSPILAKGRMANNEMRWHPIGSPAVHGLYKGYGIMSPNLVGTTIPKSRWLYFPGIYSLIGTGQDRLCYAYMMVDPAYSQLTSVPYNLWGPTTQPSHVFQCETDHGYPEITKRYRIARASFRNGNLTGAHRIDLASSFTALSAISSDGGEATFAANTTGKRLMWRSALGTGTVLEKLVIQADLRPPAGTLLTLRIVASSWASGQSVDQTVTALEAMVDDASAATLKIGGVVQSMFGASSDALTVVFLPKPFRVYQQELIEKSTPEWIVEMKCVVL